MFSVFIDLKNNKKFRINIKILYILMFIRNGNYAFYRVL